MIEKMTKYSFILMNEDKEKFIEQLSELGVMDITRAKKPMDERSTRIYSDALSIKQQMAELEAETSDELRSLQTKLAEARRRFADALAWGEFSTESLADLASKGVNVRFHRAPLKKYDPSWAGQVALEVISEDKAAVYFATVTVPGEELPAAIAATEVVKPSESVVEAQSEIDSLEAAADKELASIREAKERELPRLKKLYDSRLNQLDRYFASSAAASAAEDKLTVLVGFAPCTEDERLKAELDATDAFWMSEPAAEDDNPPIKLRNNWFSRKFECITGMYGMPVYGEFDPTPIISIFFLLFFAMCMGDAGYGLILLLFGVALNKKWVKIGMFDGLGTLISFLGAATLVVGLVLGTAFGVNLTEVSWVPQGLKNIMLVGKFPGTDYDYPMVLSVLIGIVHLCLAMSVKAILYTKRFGFKETISTWGWLLLILGGIAIVVLMLAGVLSAGALRIAIIAVGVVSALGIFIFNKPGRNPLINIGAGLWDTYQMVTGLLGDVLSYIRLYALGLAGGMLGGAFNTLGNMVLGDGGVGKWIAFVVILLIGHTLNLLMSGLGAFVHPLRLNFLEYFKNSGYEGMGAKYNPLDNNKENNN